MKNIQVNITQPQTTKATLVLSPYNARPGNEVGL